VSVPPTAKLPFAVNVPPLIVIVLVVDDALAIAKDPAVNVSGSVEVRLLIESATLLEWTMFAAMLIVTSSVEVGTAVGLQFPGVSQLLSPASPVQETAVNRALHSSWSNASLFNLDRILLSRRGKR
jgi:hypothetical protein